METAPSKPQAFRHFGIRGLLETPVRPHEELGLCSLLFTAIQKAPLLGSFHIAVTVPALDLGGSCFDYALVS